MYMISFFTENGKDIIGFPEKLLQTFSNTGLYVIEFLVCLMTIFSGLIFSGFMILIVMKIG